MKVIGFNSSPRKGGNTETLVKEVLNGAKEKGAEIKFFDLNSLSIKGCQACMYCRGNDGCAIKDDMQSLYKEINEADGIVIGSPIYMYNVTAQSKAFIDRLFPYLDIRDYSSKIRKNSVFVATQGNPDTNTFKSNIEISTNALKLLGFDIKELIIDGGNLEKDSVAQKKDVMDKAKKVGENLVNAAKN
ncbi:MAG: hypothetical protein A2086_00710 [Spirochaetes bacterium GWD1_27_9]|nr:MAG: hypothetical protein A2Z98_03690 [Spirochaetes bacterium GWB1_27_13]OHD25897.1 MAG: hypothetical protein A2Y34_01905 [Spirochaetes bacterium GWC1_27_15]OHD32531.1 MAG: hypothetical protein A2086_00710 [Spirochaetes bacterium GWD1_27_9]